jgi:hypothetical protein
MAAKKNAKKVAKRATKKAKKKVTGRRHLRIRTADVSVRVRSRSRAGDALVEKIESLVSKPAAKSKKDD